MAAMHMNRRRGKVSAGLVIAVIVIAGSQPVWATLARQDKSKSTSIGSNPVGAKSEYPRPIEGANRGDGSPLVLGAEKQIGDMHSPSDPTTTVHVLDWDGDGKAELVCSGNDVYSYEFIDALPDGTPIVDRGQRWGLMSRQAQRNEHDQGLTGYVLVAADFDGDESAEVLIGPRYYSRKPTVALPLAGGVPTNRAAGRIIRVEGSPDGVGSWKRGSVAAIDWDGDGRVDLAVVSDFKKKSGEYFTDPRTRVSPEDQRHRYEKNGRWIGVSATPVLRLYRNTSHNGQLVFSAMGKVELELPAHTVWVSVVNPHKPKAGLLLLTYYGPALPFSTRRIRRATKVGRRLLSYSRCTTSLSTGLRTLTSALGSLTCLSRVDSISSRVTVPSLPHGVVTMGRARMDARYTVHQRESSSVTHTSETAFSACPRLATGGI